MQKKSADSAEARIIAAFNTLLIKKPYGAIKVTDNVAVIDYDKCTDCGTCVENCTTHCIKTEDLRGCHHFKK